MKECSFPGCGRPHNAHGLCGAHDRQRSKGKTLTPLAGPSLTRGLSDEERFWFYVDQTESCWLWTGGTDRKGYGGIYWKGGRRKVHRLSYEMAYGPIPEGAHIDHTCYTPQCVNPDHLRVVTPKQNSENRSGAQRNSTTGVRGVRLHKPSGKYHASVYSLGKCYSAGYHDTLDDAAEAARAKRLELFTNSLMDMKDAA